MHTSTLRQQDSFAVARPGITFEGARVARSAFNARYRTVCIRGSRVESVSMTGAAGPSRETADGIFLDLSGYVILPGLINAHDHLDLSIFPRLGRGPWPSWREWGAEIHRSERPRIDECLRVSYETRLWWGGIRNLLCGVTTVSHHNPYASAIFGGDFPVHVPSEYGWVHSLADKNRVQENFRETPPQWPFILHLAEGTDHKSQLEFDDVESLLPLDRRILLVHCVGLTPSLLDRAARIGVGIVWCPSSNLYTLGKTLSREQATAFPNLALGSDSPLSGVGDLLDEIRLAHDELGISAPLIYELVTSRPARLLRLSFSQGFLQPGSKADLIVTRDKGFTPADTLMQISWRDVELVMTAGSIVLLSASLAERIPREMKDGLEQISIDGTERFVRAPIQDLLAQTCGALGRTPTLSGRVLSIGTAHGSLDSRELVLSEALC